MPWYAVPDIWPAVSGWVREALAGRSLVWSERGLFEACLRRDLGLWLVVDDEPRAVVITQVQQGDEKKACFVVLVGGAGMDDWLHLVSVIEDYARDEGCDVIEAWGRKGWERAMKPFGWQAVLTAYRKDLD